MAEPIQSREITLIRSYDISRERMFELWTDAEHLARWWGPDGFTVPHAESDPRPGGALVIVMVGHGFEETMRARYVDVVAPERLAVESTVFGPDGEPVLESAHRVTFEDLDGKTRVTVHARASVFSSAALAALAGMQAGWNQSLQCLDDVVTGADDRQVVLMRQYQATPDVVFAMWLRQEDLERWWGPDGFTITIDELDPRPGGLWTFTMHGPDGVTYPNRVRYADIVPNERIVFVNGETDAAALSFTSIVTFDEMAGTTVVSLRQVFATAAERDTVVEQHHAVESGNQSLARLDDLLRASTPASDQEAKATR